MKDFKLINEIEILSTQISNNWMTRINTKKIEHFENGHMDDNGGENN